MLLAGKDETAAATSRVYRNDNGSFTDSGAALALLPLSFGLGEGGEAQAPLARVVIGGLLSSTPITLVLIPVVYSVFEQRGPGRLRGLRRRPDPSSNSR